MALQRVSDQQTSDDSILSQPVSERRKQRLLEQYLNERQRTQTVERLFERVGAFRKKSRPAPENVRDFGFKTIVFKRSFVEDINTTIVSAHDWAKGQEDFLLHHLDERLREAAAGRLGDDAERDLEAVLGAFGEMASDLRYHGYEPSLLVRAGQFGQRLYKDLQDAIQSPHEWRSQRGPEPWAIYGLIGAYAGIPILDIAQTSAPALYAVDLARFATLTRYGDVPDFEVTEFNDDEARLILAKQPRLILDPSPESGLDDERVRQLRLRVGLELWETYELTVKDPQAVVARPLVGPTVDY